MLSYLIIAIVIAVALAPLAHFAPSKHQRKLAGLREYAAVHGLFVEFRTIPGADTGRTRTNSNLIYYGKRLPASLRKPPAAAAWLQDAQGWRSLGQRCPVPLAFENFPSEVIAASVDASSCGVFWSEAGGEEAVEAIRQVLEAWSATLFTR